jgi:hypothetical protein
MDRGLIQSCFPVKIRRIMLFVIDATRSREPHMPRDAPSSVEAPRLTALSIEQAADLLRRSGSQRTGIEAIRTDLALGAPVNPDGTINLIAYGAWLVRALATRESGHGG